MKIRLRNPKKPEAQAKKFLTMKTKYKRFRLATIILSSSWIIVGITYLINNLL